jgi:hypothetical protein
VADGSFGVIDDVKIMSTRRCGVDSANRIADRAVALAADGNRDGVVGQLIRLAEGNRASLEEARDALVRRISMRSDDYEATGGLTVINAALAEVGWPAGITWESRRTRPRRT